MSKPRPRNASKGTKAADLLKTSFMIRIPRNRDEWVAEGVDWLKTIVVVMVVFLPTITFVVQGYRIPSSSMENTLLIGDFLFADKITYGARIPLFEGSRVPGLRDPEPGDIVIFKKPGTGPGAGETLIKRCVAAAGQVIEVRGREVYVDGELQEEPYTKFTRRVRNPRTDNFGPYRVPDDHIFCMGDNRDNSFDSRFFGPVPMSLVIAKADILYFSFNKENFLPRLNRIGKMLH